MLNLNKKVIVGLEQGEHKVKLVAPDERQEGYLTHKGFKEWEGIKGIYLSTEMDKVIFVLECTAGEEKGFRFFRYQNKADERFESAILEVAKNNNFTGTFEDIFSAMQEGFNIWTQDSVVENANVAEGYSVYRNHNFYFCIPLTDAEKKLKIKEVIDNRDVAVTFLG